MCFSHASCCLRGEGTGRLVLFRALMPVHLWSVSICPCLPSLPHLPHSSTRTFLLFSTLPPPVITRSLTSYFPSSCHSLNSCPPLYHYHHAESARLAFHCLPRVLLSPCTTPHRARASTTCRHSSAACLRAPLEQASVVAGLCLCVVVRIISFSISHHRPLAPDTLQPCSFGADVCTRAVTAS